MYGDVQTPHQDNMRRTFRATSEGPNAMPHTNHMMQSLEKSGIKCLPWRQRGLLANSA